MLRFHLCLFFLASLDRRKLLLRYSSKSNHLLFTHSLFDSPDLFFSKFPSRQFDPSLAFMNPFGQLPGQTPNLANMPNMPNMANMPNLASFMPPNAASSLSSSALPNPFAAFPLPGNQNPAMPSLPFPFPTNSTSEPSVPSTGSFYF
jgi:hypothetical protein